MSDLTPEEHRRVCKILGRKPSPVELGIFSVMWSEHCSYKSSKIYLKKLPTRGRRVICGPGENAGVVDIGDGLAVVFKMESHNHPSFIEPYQGAATGVGGILRDVFTMGARPIALLNSLRFGAPDHPKTPHLVNGVVAGIGGYGNCIGVPTVGGEVFFDESYNGNILVNAMCVGVVPKNRIFYAKAAGVGNPVIYVGSKTGRDGIHGATMASGVFDDQSEEKRPTVQVGDPFTEKLLMEACLELMRGKEVVGIQDMGAAGLTCSTLEMAGKGKVGIDLDLSKVPLREQGMTPYEIMLSESQERMLLVARRRATRRILKIFEKWGLDAAVVGQVVRGDRVVIRGGVIPTGPITDEAPIYRRPAKKPAYLEEAQRLDLRSLPVPSDLGAVLKKMIGSPNLCSRRWVTRQYDQMVGTNTVVLPGSDAAVIRLKEPHTDGKKTRKGLAMTTDCNSRYVFLDPRRGTMIAVAEAARNISCSGAKPLAVTDCLNFGSPENPGIMWQFREALKGMSEACRVLGTPIVSGNVSFYNESPQGAICPTPTVGMIGLLDDVERHCTIWFKSEGDILLLLGETYEELGGSEYLKVIHGLVRGAVPQIRLKKEKIVQALCREGIAKGWVRSAHDCSDGGLAIALAESCLIPAAAPWGVSVEIPQKIRSDSLLFGESQSRIVVSVSEKNLQPFLKLARVRRCRASAIGRVTKKRLEINRLLSIPSEEVKLLWEGGFEKCVGS